MILEHVFNRLEITLQAYSKGLISKKYECASHKEEKKYAKK